MKNLILIPILFLSYILQAQYIVVKPSQLPPATTINPTDLFILNQGTTTKKVTYSILNTVLKDTFATKNALRDTAAAIRASGGGSGSTIYASDGVYMDGDTVKLGGSIKSNYTEITTSDNATTGIAFNSDTPDNITFFASENVPYGFQHTLKFDTKGLYFTSIDTTLTTSNHLMTEAQVKREISAAVGGTIGGSIGENQIAFGSGANMITGNSNITRTAADGISIISIYGSPMTTASNYPVKFRHVGDIPMMHNGNLLEISREFTGTGSAQGNMLSILDNPTTSEAYGQAISVIVDNIERISINPRATWITTPFIFQTHNKPEGNLFEYGIQGRNKVYADTSGNLTHKAIGAEIYRGRLSGDTTQSIPTGTTPTKITAFASNGQSTVCTADKDNDRLILNKVGWYDAELSISYSSGTANVEWVAYIFGNNTEIPSIGSIGKAVTSGDGRSTQLGGRFHVSSVPYYVDYRVTHNNGGSVNVIFSRLNLRVTYQGY